MKRLDPIETASYVWFYEPSRTNKVPPAKAIINRRPVTPDRARNSRRGDPVHMKVRGEEAAHAGMRAAPGRRASFFKRTANTINLFLRATSVLARSVFHLVVWTSFNVKDQRSPNVSTGLAGRGEQPGYSEFMNVI